MIFVPEMNDPIHIFISCDLADAPCAQDLQRQLTTALQPYDVLFWSKKDVPPEEFRARAAAFLEQSNLFIALLSMNYEDSADVRWEMATAVKLQQSRPVLQIMTALARETGIPALLRPFQSGLPDGETIENQHVARDRQLRRVTTAAIQVLAATPASNDIPVGKIGLPISIQDLQDGSSLKQTGSTAHRYRLTRTTDQGRANKTGGARYRRYF